jgi:hypothetical protein
MIVLGHLTFRPGVASTTPGKYITTKEDNLWGKCMPPPGKFRLLTHIMVIEASSEFNMYHYRN